MISMTKGPSLVIFDCDGTLVDSQYVIVAAMQAAWRAQGREDLPPAEAVRRQVGLPLVEAVARLLPGVAEADHVRLAESYKTAFFELRQRPDHHEPLFPGATEALDALEAADWLLGVATGKSRRGLIATLERHGLAQRFVTLKTADDAPGKPAPDMVLQAMHEAGADPRATLVVGDTVFDIEMARNAGVAALGVAWGYHQPEELLAYGAESVVDCFAELPDAISRIAG